MHACVAWKGSDPGKKLRCPFRAYSVQPFAGRRHGRAVAAALPSDARPKPDCPYAGGR